jgi:hypothetical protein
MPGLDVGVGWRKLREVKSLVHQFPRYRLRQKHARRMALSNRFVKVQHKVLNARTFQQFDYALLII